MNSDIDHIVSRMELLDFMNSRTEEEDLSWISPVGHNTSKEMLIRLPKDNLECWYQNRAEFENVAGRRLRIADVGCGEGDLTESLAEKYSKADVFGIDISAEAIKSTIISLDDLENGFAIGGDANQILSELQEFDFIYAINVVQDSKKPIRFINNLERSLRKGGYVVITAPGKEALEMFPEHREFDNEIELPFMIMEDIKTEDSKIHWKQYAIPEKDMNRIVADTHLEIVDNGSMRADATGLSELMELLEKEERKKQAKKIERLQQKDPMSGPTVNYYLMRKK
jgi:SAM-dependent methyltransferase